MSYTADGLQEDSIYVTWPEIVTAGESYRIIMTTANVTAGSVRIFENNESPAVDLVINGYFTSDITGWNTATSFANDIVRYTSSGINMLLRNPGGYCAASQAITTIIGQGYAIAAKFGTNGTTNGARIKVGTTEYGQELGYVQSSAGDTGASLTFTATGTTTYITIYYSSLTVTSSTTCRSIKCYKNPRITINETDLDTGYVSINGRSVAEGVAVGSDVVLIADSDFTGTVSATVKETVLRSDL